MSRITRSGSCSANAARTACPRVTSTTSWPGATNAARTCLRTHSPSAATSTFIGGANYPYLASSSAPRPARTASPPLLRAPPQRPDRWPRGGGQADERGPPDCRSAPAPGPPGWVPRSGKSGGGGDWAALRQGGIVGCVGQRTQRGRIIGPELRVDAVHDERG